MNVSDIKHSFISLMSEFRIGGTLLWLLKEEYNCLGCAVVGQSSTLCWLRPVLFCYLLAALKVIQNPKFGHHNE